MNRVEMANISFSAEATPIKSDFNLVAEQVEKNINLNNSSLLKEEDLIPDGKHVDPKPSDENFTELELSDEQILEKIIIDFIMTETQRRAKSDQKALEEIFNEI